ncbi:ATP-dependent Clp protease ATP-binding subunit [Candidatus Parcubacteria bacterium]|nr:ATP-dependent Clp protease ATP-binding subunit [Candidatus Parcubacteria bacterium]
MQTFLDKFTISYKDTIKQAFDLAWKNSDLAVNPEHLFCSLIIQKGSLANHILKRLKITATQLKRELLPIHQPGPRIEKNRKHPAISNESKGIIKRSAAIASAKSHKFIGTEHLLIALIKSNSPEIIKFFKRHKIDSKKMEEQIIGSLKTLTKFSQLTNRSRHSKLKKTDEGYFEEEGEKDSDFIIDLTNRGNVKKIDPVIAREDEISRIIQVLSRRSKNNPLLLGEPGVGKTAIIEGLAKKIASMDVPPFLYGKKIIKLNMGSMIAGTMFRGEFESRLKMIIEKIQNDPNSILFIDEIHNIVGAGSSSGNLDAANILKPALARGEFRLIGATTFADYKKQIEKDRALKRRFATVKIEEPNAEKSREILIKLKKYYEKFHKIEITEQAINSAIKLSDRYLTNSHLPDKAIDLIDEAAAKVKIKKEKHNFSFLQTKFRNKLEKIELAKQRHINCEDYSAAVGLRKDADDLIKEFKSLEMINEELKKTIIGKITNDDIVEVISRITNIPKNQLNSEDADNLLGLEKKLREKIIGQEKSIKTVVRYLKRGLLNISSPHRPMASFMFLGPVGVGKTELAKQIAKLVFGEKQSEDGSASTGKSSIIKLDMSEFNDKFNVSRLIGAPAGYVGYDEGGKLTEFVKHNPRSLILFDEIEKAHPEVANILLQILEDGILTDASGEEINFKNCLIILTSNIGMKEFYAGKNIGFSAVKQSKENFSELKDKILNKLKNRMRPELLSRLDKILVFNPLNKKDIEKIVKLQLEELNGNLVDKKIRLSADAKAIKDLALLAYSPEQGARAVRKIIQEEVEDKLVEIILKEKKGDTIKTKNGVIKVVKV